jgi:hypothetical protein
MCVVVRGGSTRRPDNCEPFDLPGQCATRQKPDERDESLLVLFLPSIISFGSLLQFGFVLDCEEYPQA